MVVPNPDNDQMKTLIVNAQVNLLPALAVNGFKLKILIALFAGRHCLVNSIVRESTSINKLCHVADTDVEIVNEIHLLMKERFTDEMIHERQKVLSENFDIVKNTRKLIELVFNKSSN
jgi:hypothetical protein